MQRVSALLPSWERTKSTPSVKSGGGIFGWGSAIKASNSRNSLPVPRHYGREHYWPTNLDRECEKAARILQSFCNGYLAQDDEATSIGPAPQRGSLRQCKKKIPPRIIQNAAGLAIFSCMRSGLWMSGSGGSGILIARKSDGTWSPPSGFLLHTAALGFVIGVDIYDCVLVINSVADLEMFTRPRVTLGADVHLTVGPLVSAGLLENEIRTKDLENTVLTYLKARGQHRAVNIDGSVVTERGNENERFYGKNVAVLDVLAGEVRKDIPEIRPLYEVIKAAEGRVDFEAALLEQLALQPAPGDAVIDTPSLSPLSPGRPAFGIPSLEDPDPFGVIALEMAGLEIREAGTRQRPSSSQFEYNPMPTSPMLNQLHRQSTDTYMSQSNRGSVISNKTTLSRMTDAYTQTSASNTRGTTPVSAQSDDGQERASTDNKLPIVMEPDDVEIDYTEIDVTPIKHLSQDSTEDAHAQTADIIDDIIEETPQGNLEQVPEEEPQVVEADQSLAKADKGEESSENLPNDERDEDADDEDEDEDEDDAFDDEEEPVVFEVATAAPPQRAAIMSSQVTQLIHAKGALVTIPKRVAPPVPPRSPARTSRCSKSEFGDIPEKSPLRNSFQSTASRDAPASKEEHDHLAPPASEFAVSRDEEGQVPDHESAQTSSEVVETKTTSSSDRLSIDQHGASSSVYTAVAERRLSSDDVPPTPSTLQTSGHTSSGEEDHEPKTPKPESDVDSNKHNKSDSKDPVKMESNPQEATPIAIA